MLRQVDRCNGHVIHKVITPKQKVIGYQVSQEGVHDASKVRCFAYLSAAREAAKAEQPTAH